MPVALRTQDPIIIDESCCLLNVDDVIAFLGSHGGGLPVAGGEEIAPFIQERLYPLFPREQRVATCDMHPEGQITSIESYVGLRPFQSITSEMARKRKVKLSEKAQFQLDDVDELLYACNGSFTVWPSHGKAGTIQTALDPALDPNDWSLMFPKGMDPTDDANGAFVSMRGQVTHLDALLWGRGFTRLFVVGLAYDVCAGLSAIQGASLGFDVYVIKEGTRAINTPRKGRFPGSVEVIEQQFAHAHVTVIEDASLLQLA